MEANPSPRARPTHDAIVAAAVELLAERGPTGVTHQRVAERARVGRATVYRHWPEPADLLYAAVQEIDAPLLRPADAPLRPWLRAELRRIAADISEPSIARPLLVLLERATTDGETAALRDSVKAAMVGILRAAITTAVREGTLRRAPRADTLAAQLIGPIMYRAFFEGRAADRAFLDDIIDTVLGPWEAS